MNRINLEWEFNDIKIPNVTDKDTVVTLATISSNAYVRYPKSDDEKKKSDWIDLGDWDPNRENSDINFGWDDIGLRGHVFVSKDNKTVVVGIKGTSGAGLPGGGSDETGVTTKPMIIYYFHVVVQELVICGPLFVIVMKRHIHVIKIALKRSCVEKINIIKQSWNYIVMSLQFIHQKPLIFGLQDIH